MNIIFLEDISDCLRVDRVGDDLVNKSGGLNSIVKPSSGDLIYDGLFVV